MTTTEIILLILVICCLILCGFMFFKLNNKNDNVKGAIDTAEIKSSIEMIKNNIPFVVKESLSEKMVDITKSLKEQSESTNNQINSLTEKMNNKLGEINSKVEGGLKEGFKSTGEVMASLQKQMGTISEAQNNMKGLSEDVVSLKNVLTNNQSRGKYGEMQLEMILENIFNGGKGKLYDTQFDLGEDDEGSKLKPDAVVFIEAKSEGKKVCIDSKFSLVGLEDLFDSKVSLSEEDKTKLISSFKGALKLRIKETSKYIVKNKTIDNSIMFIPNDGIFAFIENECSDVTELARTSGVILASPSIIPALLASLRLMQIDALRNENLDKITKTIQELGTQFGLFKSRWDKLNKEIVTVANTSSQFDITVKKITKRFNNIATSDQAILSNDEIEAIEEDNEEDSI